MNMKPLPATCCICLKTFEARDVQPPVGDVCPDAPMICVTCRSHPGALDVARLLMEDHLAAHRSRGDFERLKSSGWRDPWRATA
jgi:hypothetical protein